MRITSKGQVTIPQEIRERMGLLPNTEVEFRTDGDLVFLVKATVASSRPTRGERLMTALRSNRSDFGGMTTDEVMALLRGEP
jgi:AbrB family looped-hinge helix DNA binding protein